MAKVAEYEGLEPSFGQSPFALTRGEQFERTLFWDNATRLFEQLVANEVLPPGANGFLDLRLKMNGGSRVLDLDQAIDETSDLLRRVASRTNPPPAVVAGATVRIPKGVMLPEAVLIIDVLAIRLDGTEPLVTVGEIKTYPDRGGYTDRGELATARAQAGIYVHALQLVAATLGIADQIEISERGFLVLTRPGSNWPRVRAGEDLRYQARRAARGFDQLERAAQALPSVPDEDDDAKIKAVITSPISYREECLSFCDRAAGCYQQALAGGDPIVLGEEVHRFLGGTNLHRLDELLDGATPRTSAEVDLMRRIKESDKTAAR